MMPLQEAAETERCHALPKVTLVGGRGTDGQCVSYLVVPQSAGHFRYLRTKCSCGAFGGENSLRVNDKIDLIFGLKCGTNSMWKRTSGAC